VHSDCVSNKEDVVMSVNASVAPRVESLAQVLTTCPPEDVKERSWNAR
jgi:hypothetical protein